MKKPILFIIFLIFIITGVFFYSNEKILGLDKLNSLASIFFVDSVTELNLKNKYNSTEDGVDRVKILVVPGHDNRHWGTSFRGVKEADLNLELAESLFKYLNDDDKFDAYLIRDRGGYKDDFVEFLKKNREGVVSFYKEKRRRMNSYIDAGILDAKRGVVHNSVTSEVAIKLYGINKWANENNIDIVLHIHFNDYPRRYNHRSGIYSGYSIYIPENQYSNHKVSKVLADNIYKQLGIYLSPSDLPLEKDGIIEDQELIAIGSNNSLDAASLLIEYGYIYEPQFTNRATRPIFMKELAAQTYIGLKKYFEEKSGNFVGGYNLSSLPYKWNSYLDKGIRGNKDVLVLQMALARDGIYPTDSFSKNDCPITGNFGRCTLNAVVDFQKRYSILPATGNVGPKTLERLNQLYFESMRYSD